MLNTIRPDTSVEVINVDYKKFDESILTDANYLYDGYLRAKNGSSWKPEVQRFEANFLLEIASLQHQLKEGTYKSDPPNSFIIHAYFISFIMSAIKGFASLSAFHISKETPSLS